MKKIVKTLIIFFIILINFHIVNGKDTYNLSKSDYKIISQINNKLENFIDNNSIESNKKLVLSLRKTQNKSVKNERLYLILNSIINNSEKIIDEKNYLNHYKNFNINFDELSKYWLKLHNDERNKIGLLKYSYDQRLNNTAYEWSTEQKNRGVMEHKRNPSDSYYDYNKIENWFNIRGINCKVINHTTSSESIGKFGYYCNDNDCTQELEESTKVIFDMYMAEKGKGFSYDVHYRAIIHPDITKIGLGISIKKTSEKDYYEYYITTHYCTEFINNN